MTKACIFTLIFFGFWPPDVSARKSHVSAKRGGLPELVRTFAASLPTQVNELPQKMIKGSSAPGHQINIFDGSQSVKLHQISRLYRGLRTLAHKRANQGIKDAHRFPLMTNRKEDAIPPDVAEALLSFQPNLIWQLKMAEQLHQSLTGEWKPLYAADADLFVDNGATGYSGKPHIDGDGKGPFPVVMAVVYNHPTMESYLSMTLDQALSWHQGSNRIARANHGQGLVELPYRSNQKSQFIFFRGDLPHRAIDGAEKLSQVTNFRLMEEN